MTPHTFALLDVVTLYALAGLGFAYALAGLARLIRHRRDAV